MILQKIGMKGAEPPLDLRRISLKSRLAKLIATFALLTCATAQALQYSILDGAASYSSFQSFIKKVEGVFTSNGIQVSLAGNGTPDLRVFFGPNQGGFMGKPEMTIGLNSNRNFRFTKLGIYASAHEFGHFFGYQDLYPADEDPILKTILTDDYRS